MNELDANNADLIKREFEQAKGSFVPFTVSSDLDPLGREVEHLASAIITKFALLCVAALSLLGLGGTGVLAVERLSRGHFSEFLQLLAFVPVAVLLCYGTFTYLMARIGRIVREERYSRPSNGAFGSSLDLPNSPTVTALVPAYLESESVVRKTLLSIALQEYPGLRVVLLIDDPPDTTDPLQHRNLEAMRRLPKALQAELRGPAEICRSALEDHVRRTAAGMANDTKEMDRLAELYDRAAGWLESWANHHEPFDCSDQHFVEITYLKPAVRYRNRASYWRSGAVSTTRPTLKLKDLRDEFQSLVNRFCVEFSSFERKKFANLSHRPNKASNLNSYIGLLGGSYQYVSCGDAICIEPSPQESADLTVVDAELLLILDADTIITPDYARLMVSHMYRDGNKRLAVVQSPYSTFPDSPNKLQRIAGAQTDIQFLVHQGMAYHNSAFWVGANAMVRVAALREIATTETETGVAVRKFIPDSTPIEDTEASLDLALHGWQIFNHLERLAFSVTPADFGSLITQRRRWASGGLLLVPKLMRYWREHSVGGRKWREVFMRGHYLLSLGPVSISLLILMLFTFEASILYSWIFVIAIVYFFFYARDLQLHGYRGSDLWRVFSLNLLLVPVNISGMIRSVYQGATGRRTQFGRTPKVRERVTVHWSYLVAEVAGLTYLVVLVIRDALIGNFLHGSFIALHAVFLGYAIATYIGIRPMCEDLGLIKPK